MIRYCSFERAWLVILDVEGQSSFQELYGEVVFADRVEDEADVAVDEGNFGMILANHHQGEISGAVKQFQRSAEMTQKINFKQGVGHL